MNFKSFTCALATLSMMAMAFTAEASVTPEQAQALRSERSFEISKERQAEAKSAEQKGIIVIDESIYNEAFSIAWDGSSVELVDGSVWNVYTWHRGRVSTWLPGDVITVSQSGMFSMRSYTLHNETLGEAADVSLTAGPFYAYSKSVVYVDYLNCEVLLSDGSIWTVAFADSWTLDQMRIGDGIIVGFNDELFPGSYGYILIDVELNEYVRAY